MTNRPDRPYAWPLNHCSIRRVTGGLTRLPVGLVLAGFNVAAAQGQMLGTLGTPDEGLMPHPLSRATLLTICMTAVITYGVAWSVFRRRRSHPDHPQQASPSRSRTSMTIPQSDQGDNPTDAWLDSLSYEIRSSLNGILGMSNLLEEAKLPSQTRGHLDAIRTSAEYALRVLQDVTDLSNVDPSHIQLDYIHFELLGFLEETMESMKVLAAEKHLDLILRCSATPGTQLIGDPERLRRILHHLIRNAIAHTEAGYVLVDAECQHAANGHLSVRFTVKDTGLGMASGKLNALIEPFSKQHRATPLKRENTGLGLALTHHLVERMQGTMEMSSRPGEGSTFALILTFRQAAHAPLDSTLADNAPCPRVLVVDDNELSRRVLGEQLSRWGLRHALSATGKEGFDQLRKAVEDEDPFDIVLIDYCMPEMDGETLGNLIRTDSRLHSTRLLLLSSVHDPALEERVLRAGFSACLLKPAGEQRLKAEILHQPNTVQPPPAQERSLPLTSKRVPSPPCTDACILVVEDNPVNQNVILHMLKKLGYHAEVATNGKEAVDCVETKAFDLVLMDCQMPVMSGYEATKIIRKREQDSNGTHVAIVAVTAHSRAGDREKCLLAGMDDYLSKPVRRNELQAMLDKYAPRDRHHEASSSSPVDQPNAAARADRFDPQTMLNHLEGNVTLLKEITSLFFEDVPSRLAEIDHAIASHDSEALTRAAHKLKGAVGNFHAPSAYEAADRLETLARQGSLEGIERPQQRLVRELERLQKDLAAFTASIEEA